MLASATRLAGCSLHEKRKTNPKEEKFRIWVLSVNYCMSLYVRDFSDIFLTLMSQNPISHSLFLTLNGLKMQLQNLTHGQLTLQLY